MTRDIRLDGINIVVGDMEASAAFYRLLGFDAGDVQPPWDAHHRTIGTDDDPVDIDLDSTSFAGQWDEGWPGGTGIVLTFRVRTRDDVDRVHGELVAAGHRSQQPPYDAFWGARYAIVADPDGNAVGLMSPADDAHRTAPPTPGT